MNKNRIVSDLLWDLPTRLFHWLLVLAIFVSWLSHEIENITFHKYAGYTALVLVVFRILWGFVGSTHSRFSDFIRGPAAIKQYLRGEGADTPGHNPLGALSVVVLLLLVLAQTLTGLFNSDDIFFDGPFHHALSSNITDQLGALHELIWDLLQVFILLHIAAVLFHQFKKGEDQIPPMISGRSAQRPGVGSVAPLWQALVIVIALAALLAYLISIAPPPPSYW